ncbi:MAG: bifunctional 4-hydroxy-2-oxoglutarate aldolase/2-dehydro-3-deoxy-phosphogluconate aldolase [Candidatus Limnocylindrales bacterium]
MRPELPDAIAGPGIVAIGRGLPRARALQIGEVLSAAGIRAFEIPLTSADALEVIAAIATQFPAKQLLVGAGTVLSITAAQEALDAGAAFLVMPNVDPDLIRWAVDRGVPNLPGAMTPTEVLLAWRAGASAVKIFPASVVGPGFLTELRGPMADIVMVPTGGISAANAGGFVAAGAAAVGVGSWLCNAADPATVRDRADELCASVNAARDRIAARAAT